MRMRRTAIAALMALVVAVGAFAIFHDAAIAAGIRLAAGAAGYTASFGRLSAGLGVAVATDMHVGNRAGEPVFSADRIELHYSLRDLLPGSSHRFGLSALDIARPIVTLIHHADGTYNVALPAGAQAPAKPDTTPLNLRARVRDGSVVLLDRFTVPNQERRQRIVGLAADLALAPHEHSFYTIRFDLDDGRALHPVAGRATFATDRGYTAQRWTAADLPIGPLIDFALPSHALNLVDGSLKNLDARIYTFLDPDDSVHTHVSARADLERGKLYVAGVAKPLRDAHGTLTAYDDGLTTKGIDATLAGVPLHFSGGVYGLAAPNVRFVLTGSGPIDRLRTIAPEAQRQPLSGNLSFVFRANGPLGDPTITGTFAAPQMTYRTFRFDRPSGSFALRGKAFDLLAAHVMYGPLRIAARGSLLLDRKVTTDLVVTVAGPGDAVPYASQIVRGLHLGSAVHISGVGEALATNGIVYGQSRDGSLDALFNVDAGGNGIIGPVSVERSDGASLYARVAVDRTRNDVSGIVDAHRFSLLPGRVPHLPGLTTRDVPAIAGTLDAQLALAIDGARLTGAAGHASLRGLRYGAIAAHSVDVAMNAGTDGVEHARVSVHSSLGDLDGTGAYGNGIGAFDGRLHTSLASLQPIANVRASGTIDAPLRLLTDGRSTAVQISGARLNGVRIAGVPVRDAEATAVIGGDGIDVRAARLGIAGGSALAAGRFGAGGELDVATSALDVRSLAAGAPLAAGTLRAMARVRGTASDPVATIGVALDGARMRGIGASGNAVAHYRNGQIRIPTASAIVAGALIDAHGTANVRGTPTIDATATVRGAQIASLARALKAPLRYPEGELDADVRAQGPAANPRITGTVRIPRGSLNGLAFSDAAVAIGGSAGGVTARGGHVTVGSTAVAFDGDFGTALQRIDVRAPRTNLADFNDYFDAAETLSGHGAVAANARLSPQSVRTTGAIAFADARFKRFAVGTIAVNWRTDGRVVRGTGNVRGDRGTAALTATLTMPEIAPLRDPFHRITLDSNVQIAGVAIGDWLGEAGMNVPVTGTLDGTGRATGTLGAPSFAANAGLTGGAVAGYPLSAAMVAITGNGTRAQITTAHVAGPGLRADVNGSFGYRTLDPIAIALHAQSDDIGVLTKRFANRADVGGSVTTDVRVTGTRQAPQIAQTFDAQHLRSGTYEIVRAHAQLAADSHMVRLQTFEADLSQGRLLASASLPIALGGSGFAVRDAPASANVRADGIDLVQFAGLLPNNSRISGVLNGQLAASGTLRDPALAGSLALTGGSYASTLLRSELTNVHGRLDLARNEARLTGLHADAGGGAFDGSGTATFGDVRDLRHTLAFTSDLTAKSAGLDIDKLFRGKIDGTVHATQARGGTPLLAGDVTFSQTRIPLTALLPPSNPNAKATIAPFPVAFDLNVTAGNDVRVQSSNVDVGARGSVRVAGTLAKPSLDGSLQSTDGTLSFYRTFVLQHSTVAFAPDAGLIPTVDATATTHIADPNTDVMLKVTGPATALNLDLASNPTYDKSQILGLLVNAQALGAVSGVQTAQADGSNGPSVTGLVGGALSQQFTRGLLQPIGSQIGSALGFSDLALGYDFGNGFSAGAQRSLGKNLTASFNQTFGTDQRQTVALENHFGDDASVQLTVFNAGNQSPRITGVGSPLAPTGPTNFALQALTPPPGVSGYVFSYQRKYP